MRAHVFSLESRVGATPPGDILCFSRSNPPKSKRSIFPRHAEAWLPRPNWPFCFFLAALSGIAPNPRRLGQQFPSPHTRIHHILLKYSIQGFSRFGFQDDPGCLEFGGDTLLLHRGLLRDVSCTKNLISVDMLVRHTPSCRLLPEQLISVAFNWARLRSSTAVHHQRAHRFLFAPQ